MSSFRITGNQKLAGEIVPQGAKNEALQVLCAVLLTSEEVIIHNIPDILDIRNLIGLLADMGVSVQQLNTNSYSFKAESINQDYFHTR